MGKYKKKTKIVKLKENKQYKFIPKTDTYGCAEFQVCFKVVRGKLKKVFISPRQQPDTNVKWYEYELNYKPIDWSIGCALIDHELEYPRIWLMGHCKEHNCITMSIYPPKYTNSFSISCTSNFQIRFDKV